MLAMIPRLIAIALLVASTPLLAVGLGPLSRSGIVDGPRKAFHLTLLNPYDAPVDFVAYGIGESDEAPAGRVAIFPAAVRLGARRSRDLLVIARDLAIGETFTFRVCAQRLTPPQGIRINARVCSKLSARRVA